MNDIVFLLDVDNTLIDNDRIKRDFGGHLDALLGDGAGKRYWPTYESVRDELGYADYLAAIQRCWDSSGHDPRWLPAAGFMLDCPFADYFYPRALDVLDHLRAAGRVWIVSDGDAVFQPHKIRHSGLWQALDGNVLIYRHKQRELGDIDARCSGEHYVLVDDKPDLLDAFKKAWSTRVTTVHVHQGHYAAESGEYSGANVSLERIAELLTFPAERLRQAATGSATSSSSVPELPKEAS